MEWTVLDAIPHFKDWIKEAFGYSDALVHVNVGMALFLMLALLLRKRKRVVLIAWLIVLTVQIGNEAFDAWIEIQRRGRIDFVEAWKDTVATVFWPTILLLIWFALRSRRRDPGDSA